PAQSAKPAIGRMVFVRTFSDGKDIVVREDNGGELRLVSGKVEERRPALSPDGRQVAFVGTEVGKSTRVCVIGSGGGTYFCLANAALDSSLAWSADGSELFFARDSKLYSVLVAPPPSPAPTEVDRNVAVTANNFSMNPARSAIVTPTGAGLTIRPLDHSPAIELVGRGQPANVAWSPGGDLVAFSDGNDVWVTDARSGGSVRQLTDAATVETEPGWSRDGQWVVYRSNATGSGDLYAVGTAPGSPPAVRVTVHDAADITPAL
ncbi:MAG: LpqB family beta-propeller domain-containing protein, partial [Acidimicrobiales bacterium]